MTIDSMGNDVTINRVEFMRFYGSYLAGISSQLKNTMNRTVLECNDKQELIFNRFGQVLKFKPSKWFIEDDAPFFMAVYYELKITWEITD